MDRDSIIDTLTAAFSDGSLPMEEFERRVELANRTDTADALRALVEDLPRPAADAPPLPARTGRSVATRRTAVAGRPSLAYLENPGPSPGQGEIVSIFSSNRRVGRWTAPLKLEIESIFGSGYVDLREALIPREGMRIEAVGIFGSTSIVVPEGVNVRVESTTIFGSVTGGEIRAEDPSAPTIVIEAVAIFGSVGVQVKSRE